MPLDHEGWEKRAQMFLKTLHPLLFVYLLALPTQPHCLASRKLFSCAEASRSPALQDAQAHAAAGTELFGQMFCIISMCASRKCLFALPKKTIAWSRTLFLCLKRKKVPKQADSCKRLERNRPPLYSSCPVLSPSPAPLCCSLVSHSGWSQRKGKINM